MNCPSCNHRFETRHDGAQWLVWCGHGPCKSKAANDGLAARILDEAVKQLVERIEEEMDGEKKREG